MTMEAIVTFEYEAQEPDELTLKVGDVIIDVNQTDDGWASGVLRGRRGVFPDNFVEFRPVKAVLPEPAAVVRDPAHKTRRVRVTFSYIAENEDELSLQPGQILEDIVEEEPGWWRGNLSGKVGVFPSNFVEELGDIQVTSGEVKPAVETKPAAEVKPAEVKLPEQPKNVSRFRLPGMDLPKGPPPTDVKVESKPVVNDDIEDGVPGPISKFGPKLIPDNFVPALVPLKKTVKDRVKVTSDWIATRPEEIDVKAGDTVDVLKKDALPGFWEVRIGEKTGLVPESVVDMLTPNKKPIPASSQTPFKLPPPVAKKELPPAPPKPVAQEPPVIKPAMHEPEPSSDLTESIGVPPTPVLDTTIVKSRPKAIGRPPSTSKLLGMDEVSAPAEVPWKEEIKKKKAPLPPPPPAPAAGSVAVTPGPGPVASSGSVPFKPKLPPPVKGDGKVASSQPSQPVEKSMEKVATEQEKMSVAPSGDDLWKEAFERLQDMVEKFKADSNEKFEKFKAESNDKFEKLRSMYRRDIDTLTKDLDEERKKHAATQIELDRLKKSVADMRDK